MFEQRLCQEPEKSAVQTLDLNGIPAWNGFRSFSTSPGPCCVGLRALIGRAPGGYDGAMKRERLTEIDVNTKHTMNSD